MNGFQDDFEDTVHDPVHVLGIELLGHRGKSRHVREHHRDDLSLALDRSLGGEDFFGEVLRRVGLRRREPIGGARRSGSSLDGCWLSRQRCTTFAAELLTWGVLRLTRRAYGFEAGAALAAELLTWRILVLTASTLHQLVHVISEVLRG